MWKYGRLIIKVAVIEIILIPSDHNYKYINIYKCDVTAQEDHCIPKAKHPKSELKDIAQQRLTHFYIVATNLELILYFVCVFQIISCTVMFYYAYCILLFNQCLNL